MAADNSSSGAGPSAAALQQIWTQTVDRVKRDIIAPSLWRALEKTLPVTLDNGTFAVGLAPGEAQYAGTMNTGEYRAAIERILRTVSGDNSLTFRLIEGTTLSDWEYTKARDAAAVAQRQQSAQRRTVESAAFNSWDDINDQVSRLWASSEFRSLASGKGRYLDQALALVQKAVESLAPDAAAAGNKPNEQTERGLSRVLERIAGNAGTDATLVAYLLHQRRANPPGD